jgi:hypothetical protein
LTYGSAASAAGEKSVAYKMFLSEIRVRVAVAFIKHLLANQGCAF